MSTTELANYAEIVAGFGVTASLIFVALEIRKGTAQSKLANWASLVDRYNAVYSQTNDIYPDTGGPRQPRGQRAQELPGSYGGREDLIWALAGAIVYRE